MRRLLALFSRARRDREIAKELRFHLDRLVDEQIAAGVPPEEARRQAGLRFGGLAQTAEAVHDVWRLAWLDHLRRDLRDGWRALRRAPGMTATAVLLIGLVIGGNTTIYSMVHGLLAKPAPGITADRLVTLSVLVDGRLRGPEDSYPNYRDYAAQARTLRSLVAYQFERFTLGTDAGSYAVLGAMVSPDYFDALGLRPAHGRGLTTADESAEAAGLTAVISERLWQTLFQGAPDVLGRSILLNGHAATIVGVAPPRFHGVTLAEFTDVWTPIRAYARAAGTERTLETRDDARVIMIGQLAPGVGLEAARAEIGAIATRLQRAYPDSNRARTVTIFPYFMLGTGSGAFALLPRFLAIFTAVAVLTLLIVCANVANLMLARAAARQREMAVRQSLGASRGRLLGALMAEGLLVSLAAWLVACALARLFTVAVLRLVPPSSNGLSVAPDFTPDGQVALYAMGMALLSTVAFSVAPALRAWRMDALPWLRAGEQGVIPGRSRLSSALVVLQLTFAVALITAAGLAWRSLSMIHGQQPGFAANELLLVTVSPSGSANTPAANLALIDRLRDRLRAAPGVEAVSYVTAVPPWSAGSEPLRTTPEQAPILASRNFVGPDYLRTHGLAPIEGREFDDRDGSSAAGRPASPRDAGRATPHASASLAPRASQTPSRDASDSDAAPGSVTTRAARTAIVNQQLARDLWPGQSALGRTVLVGNDRQPAEIVGIAPDAFFSGFQRDTRPRFIFFPRRQAPPEPGHITFYIRRGIHGDAAARDSVEMLAPTIARALRAEDARVPIVYMRGMPAQLASITWPERALTVLLLLFAAGSLAIAAIGQYAVMAFTMRRRTREFGLRLALGASTGHIRRVVLREGLRLTAIGLTLGFTLSLVAGIAARRLLFGVTPTDAWTYAGVFALLTVVSLAAGALPALRAARVDPMRVLRED